MCVYVQELVKSKGTMKNSLNVFVSLPLLWSSSVAYAADLDLLSIQQRLNRNVELLSALDFKGVEVPKVAEILKHHVDIYNEIGKELAKREQEKQENINSNSNSEE